MSSVELEYRTINSCALGDSDAAKADTYATGYTCLYAEFEFGAIKYCCNTSRSFSVVSRSFDLEGSGLRLGGKRVYIPTVGTSRWTPLLQPTKKRAEKSRRIRRKAVRFMYSP